MDETENIRRFTSLAWFFLKTYFFNPLNNPVFVVLGVFIVVFLLDGSLNKQNIALILYLSIISHYFMGNLFKTAEDVKEDTSRAPVMRYFHTLPITGNQVYYSYLLSSMVYVIFTYIILTSLLFGIFHVTDYSEFNMRRQIQYFEDTKLIKTATSDGDTVTVMEGFIDDPSNPRTSMPIFISEVLTKSLLFDPFLKIKRGYFWISLYFLLTFLYFSILHIYGQVNPEPTKRLLNSLYKIPLLIYLLIALIFLAEIILTQKEISIYTKFIIKNLDIIAGVFIGTVVWTTVSMLLMSGRVLKQLKGVGK